MPEPSASLSAVTMTVNGTAYTVSVHPMARLLDVLRQQLKLTGSKEGCGEGECGACSVFIDGVLTNSCLVPVLQADGAQIQTVEGLAGGEALDPLQEAFIEAGGAQCGICTPGMLVAAASLLRRNESPSEADIREGLAGNLCRCTGYTKIVDSVVEAARRLASGGHR